MVYYVSRSGTFPVNSEGKPLLISETAFRECCCNEFLLIEYIWEPKGLVYKAGEDLDTCTEITSPSVPAVGFCQIPKTNSLAAWSGDNRGNGGKESILIDVDHAFFTGLNIEIDCSALWYPRQDGANAASAFVTLYVTHYMGGCATLEIDAFGYWYWRIVNGTKVKELFTFKEVFQAAGTDRACPAPESTQVHQHVGTIEFNTINPLASRLVSVS